MRRIRSLPRSAIAVAYAAAFPPPPITPAAAAPSPPATTPDEGVLGAFVITGVNTSERLPKIAVLPSLSPDYEDVDRARGGTSRFRAHRACTT